MAEFKTSKRRPVEHFHSGVTLGPEIIEQAREWMRTNFPNAVERKEASCSYNCHGYSFASRHAWFSYPRKFMSDDYVEVEMGEAQVGDLLIYFKGRSANPSHSARVTDITEGEITEVRSKWGGQAEVLHHPDEVPPVYGRPTRLLRRSTDFVPPDGMEKGAAKMLDEKARREAVDRILTQFSDPNVYLQLLLSSTPEVTREIIETLPGVQELIAIGPEGGASVLEFFDREETQNNFLMSNIALYLLQRIPTPEATPSLARFLRSERIDCADRELAAEAFLASAGIEFESGDIVSFAIHEAKKIE